MKRRRGLMLLILGAALSLTIPLYARAGRSTTGLYPDLRTVVPVHLQIVNQQQRTILRFSNGIANTGDGPWQLRPESVPPVTNAIQEIVNASGQVVEEHLVSTYEFHEEHNHWHIGDVALFEARAGSPTGPIVGSNSVKVSFCLIDLYRLEGNAPTSQKTFWDCYTSYQGVSAGWVDQYHQSTDGQQLDLTGAPPGRYYLVSTTNPLGTFVETDLTNNTAWTSFDLSYDNTGNAKIAITGRSPCESPGLCGERSANR
ncbi:MAG TPA: lysyl oxidase family protein [Herpetosiphonaceae bacterium]